MSPFLDGPAKNEEIPLPRTPPYLRVVQNGPVIAALAQLNDEPDPADIIYVYQRVAPATYQLLSRQPTDPEIRETEDWRHWALQQVES